MQPGASTDRLQARLVPRPTHACSDLVCLHWNCYDLAVRYVPRVDEDHVVLDRGLSELLHALGAHDAVQGSDAVVV